MLKKIAAFLSLLIWSISTAASAGTGMSVLCVEKNGVVSIEYSVGARCADQGEIVLGAGQKAGASVASSCPSCVDSSLSPAAANSVPRISAKALALDTAVAPVAIIKTPIFTHINGLRAPPQVDRPSVRSAYIVQRSSLVILQ